MQGVLVSGFCGFLNFIDGGVWISAAACCLWLFWFCLCVGAPGTEVWTSACFFSSAPACAEGLHGVLLTGSPLYMLNPPKQLKASTDVKCVLRDVL
jgi:hypothetical protein